MCSRASESGPMNDAITAVTRSIDLKPVQFHSLRDRKRAASEALSWIDAQGHTLITGTVAAKRPRDSRGRFLHGWKIVATVVPFGRSIGLSSALSVEKPRHSFNFMMIEREGIHAQG